MRLAAWGKSLVAEGEETPKGSLSVGRPPIGLFFCFMEKAMGGLYQRA